MTYSLAGKRVYVAGHKGMVGSAIVRCLEREDCIVLTADRSCDLREQAMVREWMAANRPDAVIAAAVLAPVSLEISRSDEVEALLVEEGKGCSN